MPPTPYLRRSVNYLTHKTKRDFQGIFARERLSDKWTKANAHCFGEFLPLLLGCFLGRPLPSLPRGAAATT